MKINSPLLQTGTKLNSKTSGSYIPILHPLRTLVNQETETYAKHWSTVSKTEILNITF